MQSRKALLIEAERKLQSAQVSDAKLDAQWLLAHLLKMPRLQMLVDLAAQVSPEVQQTYAALIERRMTGEPLQYVLQETEFYGRPYRITASVLIPRADTETLVEAAVQRLKPEMRVLEIGVGSGAVAVSLALACESAEVTGVDISDAALAVAKENAERHGARIQWFQSDLFSALSGRRYAMILSNPPYIPSEDLQSLQCEVQHEPRLALDGGTDGLRFYREIINALPQHLVSGGSLLFEVGDGQAETVSGWMKEMFDSVQVIKDLSGLARVVTGDGYAGEATVG